MAVVAVVVARSKTTPLAISNNNTIKAKALTTTTTGFRDKKGSRDNNNWLCSKIFRIIQDRRI